MGAASADAFYGALAGFGLTVVSGALVQGQMPLRLVGGAFLCYLGVRTFLARPAGTTAAVAGGRGLLGAYLSTLGLTLTNPSIVLSFAAIFAGLGLGSAGSDYASAGVLVAGVFIGFALWWLILSGTAGAIRGRLTPSGLRWVNRLSGVLLGGIGITALVSRWPGG